MTDLFDARTVHVLGLVLLHSLWQGLVVATLAGLSLAFVRRAAARYRIACLGLLVLLAWPTLTGINLALDATASTATRTIVAEGEPAEGAPPVAGVQAPAPAALEGAAAPAEGEGTPVRAEGPSIVEPAPSFLDRLRTRLVPSLVMLWCIGVLAGLARLTLGLALVARLRRSARPAEAAVVHAARRVAADVGLRARVIVLETHRLSAPVVVGVMRPALLLPLGLASSLPPAQLEAVLAHELAHVLRRDYLVNLLQRLAETLFFHHPCAWWLSNVVRTEREHLCDDAAVRAVGGDPFPLARALATLEQYRGGAPLAAMGARGPGRAEGELLGRVRRLLGRDATGRSRRASLALQGALPALLLGLVAIVGPALAQVQEDESSSPVAGRYGTLTLADEDETLAYVQMRRTAATPDEAFTRRLLDPSGSTVSAEAWGADTDAWSERFDLEPPGTWTLEIDPDGQGEAAHYDLDLDPEAALEPGFQSVDDTSRFGWGTPVFGEDGRVEDWDADPADAGPHLLWDPVPGTAAYYVNIAPVGRSSAWSPLSPHEDRLVPGDVTSFSLASLPVGEYELRVHAFSADPRIDPEDETLRRVDESVSRARRFRSEGVRVEPVAPEGDLDILAEWVNDRLRITLPEVEGADRWDVRARPSWDVERARVAYPALRSVFDGTTREAVLAPAEELMPSVPYVVEARALPEAPEGVPAAAVGEVAVGYAGPVYAPESSSEEALLGVQFGHYSHPLAEHGMRVGFHTANALEGDAEVALVGSFGRELRRHEITLGETLVTYLSGVPAGTYRALIQVEGVTLEERAFTVPEGEPLPRPEGIRLEAPLGVAEVPQVDVADPGAVAWDPVPGADRYQVKLEGAAASGSALGSIFWVRAPRVDLTEVPGPLEPQAYELEVSAFRGGFGAGPGDVVAQDESVSDRFAFEVVAEDTQDPGPAPFHVRYGHYASEDADARLYLHLDLAPEGGPNAGPASVRVLGERGEPLAAFAVDGSARSGGYPVDPAAAAALEVTTSRGTWTVPLDVGPRPDSLAPVRAVRTEQNGAGSELLVWDPVPGAAVYEVGVFPRDGGTGTLVSAAEPRVPLAGLAPGPYGVRIWAYSRNPDVPASVLPVDLAVNTGSFEVAVPGRAAEPAPGRVEGVVRAGAATLADVAVALLPLEDGAPTWEGRRVQHTDDQGRFAFESVPPGRYDVGVEWLAPPGPDMLAQHIPFTSVAVAADATTKVPDLYAVAPIEPLGVLESGTALPGEVTLAWEPVPGGASYRVTLQERESARASSDVGPLLVSESLASPEWTVDLAGGKVHGVVVEAYDAQGVEVGRFGTLLRTVP